MSYINGGPAGLHVANTARHFIKMGKEIVKVSCLEQRFGSGKGSIKIGPNQSINQSSLVVTPA